MKDTQKPIVNTTYTVEKFDDEILLYTEAGTQAVYLNDTAHTVWLLCKEDMTVGQMVQYLEQQYPEQQKLIRGDVTGALETLLENGVIGFTDED
ncbi:MAG: hypothetical protein COA36_12730 [Desulfotalea sp.]|nr:MAG: hypothetical protein COA36_12730 [Desulfotalea sp.]